LLLQALSLETVALYACRDGYYDLPFSYNTSVTDRDRRRRTTTVPKTPTA